MSPDEDSDQEDRSLPMEKNIKKPKPRLSEDVEEEEDFKQESHSSDPARDPNDPWIPRNRLPDLAGVPGSDLFNHIALHIYGGDDKIPSHIRRLEPHLAPFFDSERGDLMGWTWRGTTTEMSHEDIPISFAGRPIVIPLKNQYEVLRRMTSHLTKKLPSQSKLYVDPLRHDAIDPTRLLSQNQIDTFFSRYESAIGLYLMLDAMLYVVLPRDISAEEVYDLLNKRSFCFGGLQVEFVFEAARPTGGEGVVLVTPSEALDLKGSLELIAGKGNDQMPRIGQNIECFPWFSKERVYSAKHRPEAFQRRQQPTRGKVGLVLARKSRLIGNEPDPFFATIPTHIVQASLANVGIKDFDKNSYHNIAIRAVEDTGILGRVGETFDPAPGVFPDGYFHDVSLVSVDSHGDSGTEIFSPNIVNINWARTEELQDIRNYGESLCLLLNGDHVHAKSITPVLTRSQCQAVGQAIFRRKVSQGEIPRQDARRKIGSFLVGSRSSATTAKSWEGAVSRGLLYRISNSDMTVVQPTSGAALCIRNWTLNDDGVNESIPENYRVVGFSSFAQSAVNDIQAEGGQLVSLMQKGVISFFGAFLAPEQLKSDYVIA